MLDKAVSIAKRDLRACYGKEGIFAGGRHFRDYWARDAFFASFGALAIGDTDIVKKTLELFLGNMKPSGQLPLRVGKTTLGIVKAYFGLRKQERKPIFAGDKVGNIPMDSNALFIIALHTYVKRTKDTSMVKKHQLKAIMDWYELYIEDDLIFEDKYAGWTDSIAKQGHVLYTNVLYCRALWCMAELLKGKSAQKYRTHYKKVKKIINERFWNGEHYIDWIHDDKVYNYFSTDGNFLAVLWDITSKTKAKHVEEAAHIFDVHDVPCRCVHPPYPSSWISLQTKLLGMADYHNGLSWLWLGALNALAKKHVGMDKQARNILQKIAELIVSYDGVYEVYTKNGRPVKRIIYRGEQPFAWNAAMFLYAVARFDSSLGK